MRWPAGWLADRLGWLAGCLGVWLADCLPLILGIFWFFQDELAFFIGQLRFWLIGLLAEVFV